MIIRMSNARRIEYGADEQPEYQDQLEVEVDDGNKVRVMPERGNEDKSLVFITHGSWDEREYLAEEVVINSTLH